MTNVGSLGAYSLDLLNLLSYSQKSGANGSASAQGTSPNQSSGVTQTGGNSTSGNTASGQSSNFVLTPVIFTTNPVTGSAVATQFQVYTGTSSLPPVSLTADQLKAIQEAPITTPQLPSIDYNNARSVLESADPNHDGTISQSELESIAVSCGSNSAQADALFKELTPNGGDSININQILNTLESTYPSAS
jgi:hypothetical protein